MAVSTVGELIEQLRRYDENTRLRAAVQPSYPMGASVVGFATKEPSVSYDDDDNEVVNDEGAGTLYIVISDHEDYSAEREMWAEGSLRLAEIPG